MFTRTEKIQELLFKVSEFMKEMHDLIYTIAKLLSTVDERELRAAKNVLENTIDKIIEKADEVRKELQEL